MSLISKILPRGGGKPWAFDRLVELMNHVGTLWIFVLMIVVNLDIFGRSVLNQPLPGANEIVSMSIVGLVFLQLAHTLRSGRFLRTELIIERVQRSYPSVGLALDALYNLIGAVMMVVLLWFGIPHFTEAWEVGLYVGTLGQFTFPLWPIRLTVLFAVTITTIQFVIQMLNSMRQMRQHPETRA